MHNKVYVRLVCALILSFLGINELQGSNILSLCSFGKEQQEVHILGDEARITLFSDLCFDFESFLQKINDGPVKTAVAFFDGDPHMELFERKNCHSASEKGEVCYSLRERLLEIALGYWENSNLDAFKCPLVLKNLHFLNFPTDPVDKISIKCSVSASMLFHQNDSMFKAGFKYAGMIVKSVSDFQLGLDLDDLTKKRFFNPKAPNNRAGTFNCLKGAILTTANSTPNMFMRMADYAQVVSLYDSRINALPESTLTLPFKNRWNTLKDRALRYLTLHGGKKKDLLLVELYLKVASEKQSLIESYEEFQDMLMVPLSLINEFRTLQLLLKVIPSYDRIICFNHFVSVKNMVELLKESGFKQTFTAGVVPEGLDGLVEYYSDALTKKLIPLEKVESFFAVMLRNEAKNDCFYGDNDGIASDNSFIRYRKDDLSSKNCHICNESLKVYTAFAVTENTIYCSVNCLLKKLFNEEKTSYTLSTLLDDNRILTDGEKLILKQLGALCYLRAALLMPSLMQESSIIYQLGLPRIITLLGKIETAAKDITSPWGCTLEIASSWGIKMVDLKLFLSVYNITKQNYFQDLLKCSLHQSYTSFEAKQGILFDEKGSCAKLQKVAYATLKKTLNLSGNTEDIALLFLYNELIE
nr:hypothetical protein [Candidatus Dependentiae bacterium]